MKKIILSSVLLASMLGISLEPNTLGDPKWHSDGGPVLPWETDESTPFGGGFPWESK